MDGNGKIEGILVIWQEKQPDDRYLILNIICLFKTLFKWKQFLEIIDRVRLLWPRQDNKWQTRKILHTCTKIFGEFTMFWEDLELVEHFNVFVSIISLPFPQLRDWCTWYEILSLRSLPPLEMWKSSMYLIYPLLNLPSCFDPAPGYMFLMNPTLTW